MNILVTGANGQLGTEMRIVSRKSNDKYIFTDVHGNSDFETTILDITDLTSLSKLVREENISAIINCAAYTNVEKAEDDIDKAELLNHEAVSNLATVMKSCDGFLVHISTDYVFGKEPYNTPCREEQDGTPSGVYGETKLRGEQSILELGGNYIIIRTAWLYSEYGSNFLKTMLKLTAEKEEVHVVFDQTGTPTYAFDLANAIFDIIENRKFINNCGIYHYSNEGVCSWYDFAKVIAKYSGQDDCKILPCHSSEYPSKVTRPNYSVLDKTKFKNTFNMQIPYWTDSLKKCMKNMEVLKLN